MPLRLSECTLAPSDLHTHYIRALKTGEKEEINSHKWVQENEPGTHLKCSPQWAGYPEPGDVIPSPRLCMELCVYTFREALRPRLQERMLH